MQSALPSTSCHADGVTVENQAIAGRLRPSMTGRRLGRAVNGYHISCARAIVSHVLRRGLPSRAAVIAVTAAITESALQN